MLEFDELKDIDDAESTEDDELLKELETTTKSALRWIVKRADDSDVEIVKKKLTELTRDGLDKRLTILKVRIESAIITSKDVPRSRRLVFWLINQEYSRRGIPPVFRNLPHVSDDNPDSIYDAFAVDLEWLATAYPNHHTPSQQWRGIFKPTSFHSTVDWIASWHKRKEWHWFCKRLSLTTNQQREMHFVKRAEFRNQLAALKAGMEATKIHLATAYHGRARDPRYKTVDYKATIQRRAGVWFCGSLAEWKPQRTADYYSARTGDSRMSRQLAANIITQVFRDVPDAKPKKHKLQIVE